MSYKYGGNWAVITGGSEGIGKAYALKLAERKMNVFLIARNSEKLEQAANEIKTVYNVEVKYCSIDLTKLSNGRVYEKLAQELATIQIGVLVNNAGAMLDTLSYFLYSEKDTLEKICDLNMKAFSLMHCMILPKMVIKKKGAIINISSGASVKPVPLMGIYSASKKFVDYFTTFLRYEYQSEGIVVQLVKPFYVSSNMTNNAQSNILMARPHDIAENSLRTLGMMNETHGYIMHEIMGWAGEIIPQRPFMFLCVHLNSLIWSFLTGLTPVKQKSK